MLMKSRLCDHGVRFAKISFVPMFNRLALTGQFVPASEASSSRLTIVSANIQPGIFACIGDCIMSVISAIAGCLECIIGSRLFHPHGVRSSSESHHRHRRISGNIGGLPNLWMFQVRDLSRCSTRLTVNRR